MATTRGRLATHFVRLVGIKKRLHRLAEAEDDPVAFETQLRRLRRTDRRRPPLRVRMRWHVERVEVEGFDLFVMSAKDRPARKVLLYLHGGGYLFGPFGTEWMAMARVAESSEADFAILLYPRAPEHDAPRTMHVARAAHDALNERYGSRSVIPIGTSAGGGLAIALMAALRDTASNELPPCAVLLSPGVDMTLEQPVGHLEKSDVLLSSDHVRSAGRVYAGALGPAHPTISPLFGNLADLPALHIFVGGAELLRPSIEAFARRATRAGTEVHVILGEDMQHTWPAAPTPEGRRALGQIVDIVTSC